VALALGTFAIGSTEFVAMGLVPDIARDLLPELFASAPEEALGRSGWLISMYALGVVVGAPVIAILGARVPRKRLLLWLLVAFTIGTVLSAVLPIFGWVMAARFAAGLPHGAYFGVASLVATSLLGAGQRGKGISIVISGLTIATLLGVPLITFLGQQAGWRIAYLVVAALFAITTIAVWIILPSQPGDPDASVRREISAFTEPRVWVALAIGTLGFSGLFAVYTYIAPVVTDVAGVVAGFVPIVLVAAGLGMTIGNFIGGWATDRSVTVTVFVSAVMIGVSLIGFALTAETLVGLMMSIFLLGASASALSPAVQTRLMDVAGDSQTLAAAANHAAFNVGNSTGAFLGGVVIAAGWGLVAPSWMGLMLCIPAIVLAAILAFGARGKRASLLR
jgi:DHA1 family inner membrane transport protein